MKKIIVTIAIMMMAVCAMAEDNPYSPDQTDLPISLEVEEVAEISWEGAPNQSVDLVVKNFADKSDPVTLNLRVLGNTDMEINCDIKTNDLAEYTALVITAEELDGEKKEKIFRRNDDLESYVESSGFPIEVSASSVGSILGDYVIPVTFEAWANHGVAAAGTTDIVLAWTVVGVEL